MKLKRKSFYRIADGLRSRGWVDVAIPPDMLRYDNAFTSDADPTVVMIPTWQGDTIRKPTVGRWNSFCLRINPLEMVNGEKVEVNLDPEAWYTYRHPAHNYTRLEKVTLARYLAAKDFRSLDKEGR